MAAAKNIFLAEITVSGAGWDDPDETYYKLVWATDETEARTKIEQYCKESKYTLPAILIEPAIE